MNIRAGPVGFFESRTAIAPRTNATSTQLSQLGPLRELFCQAAPVRSTRNPLVSHFHNGSSASFAM